MWNQGLKASFFFNQKSLSFIKMSAGQGEAKSQVFVRRRGKATLPN